MRRDGPGCVARASLPVVVAAVPVDHLDAVRIDVVETVDVDRDVVATHLRQVAAAEAVNAAVLAEEPLRDLRPPHVRSEAPFTGEKREGVRLDDPGRHGDLGTDAAVA